MKRAAVKLCDEAEALGYAYENTNSKGHLVYAHSSGHKVKINPSASDDQARIVSVAMRKATGVHQTSPGRSAKAAKARQAKERERLAAERRKVQAAHDAYLARIERIPDALRDPEVRRRIEAYSRRRDEIDALMRSIPAGGDHRGKRTARHTAGERETA